MQKQRSKKRRRIHIQSQKDEDEETGRLLPEGHIENFTETKEHVFIQPTVITVKKNRSVKLALDDLYQAIEKDKYQLPKLQSLLDMVAEKLDTEMEKHGSHQLT